MNRMFVIVQEQDDVIQILGHFPSDFMSDRSASFLTGTLKSSRNAQYVVHIIRHLLYLTM